MKIFILSNANDYQISNLISKLLSPLLNAEIKTISLTASGFGKQADFVIENCSSAEQKEIYSQIQNADLIHIFNDAGSQKNFFIEGLATEHNSLFTFTPEYCEQNFGKIHRIQFQKNRISTFTHCQFLHGLTQISGLSLPVPQAHSDLAFVNTEKSEYITLNTLHQDDKIRQFFLSKLKNLESLSNKKCRLISQENCTQFSEILDNTAIFIDAYTYLGPSPLAIQALAKGIPTLAPMTHIDHILYNFPPVLSGIPNQLEQQIKPLLSSEIVFKNLTEKTQDWAELFTKSQAVPQKWASIYKYIKNKYII